MNNQKDIVVNMSNEKDIVVNMSNQKDGILEFNSDTVEAVRKEINLEKPKRIKEAVDLLEEWIKMQNHFVKKDFPRKYLEAIIIANKGLMERAKQKIDKMCTFRTLMPEFYSTNLTSEAFTEIQDMVHHAFLPKLTKEHYRVYVMAAKPNYDKLTPSLLKTYYKYILAITEYLKINDYNAGLVAVLDYRVGNVLNYVSRIHPTELRQCLMLLTEGHSVRLKGIHLLTDSKLVDLLVALFKQTLSTKLGGRIYVHRDLDSLYEVINKDIMPEDYGGKEKSLKELHDKWLEIIHSKDFIDYFMELSKAKTDETRRQAINYNEDFIGIPGSFRALRRRLRL